jgi:hypothetical protein
MGGDVFGDALLVDARNFLVRQQFKSGVGFAQLQTAQRLNRINPRSGQKNYVWRTAASKESQENFVWFLLRHEIDFKQQSFEGEEITATTWVGKATKVTCERFTEIKRGGTVLVKAKSNWCMLEADTKKPAKISEEIRSQFGME